MQTETYNPIRVQKLLSLAEDTSVTPFEAANAVQAASRYAKKFNLSLGDIVLESSVNVQLFRGSKAHQFLTKIHSLETEASKLKKRVASLENENDALRSAPVIEPNWAPKMPDASAIREDGNYSWSVFRTLVTMKYGQDHGWQAFFLKYCNTEHSVLQQWRIKDCVPADAFQKAIDIPIGNYGKPPKIDWTNHEVRRLIELFGTKMSYKAIAKTLTIEFGRDITDNAIAGYKSRLRKQGRIPKDRA